MQAILIAVTFSALLAAAAVAQGTPPKPVPDPRTELAKVIAVEEQERDLAKAESFYREALAGKALSVGARALANARLGALLQRLGRPDEAKAFRQAATDARGTVVSLDDVTELTSTAKQDVEREAQLRAKARELVAKVLADHGQKGLNHGDSPVYGVDKALAEQLLWIGEPAVPEIVAVLEPMDTAPSYHPVVVESLAACVWRIGGAQAIDFVRRSRDMARLGSHVAWAANWLRDDPMLRVAEEYLTHPDPRLSLAMLDHRRGVQMLASRVDAATLVRAFGRGANAQRIWLVRWATDSAVDPGLVPALVAVVREALSSTEPELGAAAQRLLATSRLQDSTEGVELLLDVLPSLPDDVALVFGRKPRSQDANGRGWEGSFTRDEAMRLLPKLDAVVRALGRLPLANAKRQAWLETMTLHVGLAVDDSALPTLLAWWDLGYVHVVEGFRGRITPANAADVFARAGTVPAPGRVVFLRMFRRGDLPRAMFPALRDYAAAQPDLAQEIGPLMARTGDPAAAAWLLAARSANTAPWWVAALLELGRRSTEEPVRAAMREMIGRHERADRARLLLALLAMRDEPALALVAKHAHEDGLHSRHPYAAPGAGEDPESLSPLQYLVFAAPNPPHGFSTEQILATLRAVEATLKVEHLHPASADRVTDDVLPGVAARVLGGTPIGGETRSWQGEVLRRVRARGYSGPLHDWVLRELAARGSVAAALVDAMEPDEIARWTAQIEPMMKDPNVAGTAAEAMLRAKRPLDVAALLAGEPLRWWTFVKVIRGELPADDAALVPFLRNEETEWRRLTAEALGSRLSVAAVPDLLPLLKDPDAGVRVAATEALTKIRFHHEQQAHWDRVLKGLDASAASAAEKLLLQAKPGAPKEQRLLALQSLGVLGAPEALPFLIEWSRDADPEIQQKVKDAITQIHLHPRK